MNEILAKSLEKDFPFFKNSAYLTIMDGWEPLIREMFSLIKIEYDNLPNEYKKDFKAAQIKEKFGGLRAYFDYPEDNQDFFRKVESIVQDFERKSFKVCEFCGKEGARNNSKSWIKTTCADHKNWKFDEFL